MSFKLQKNPGQKYDRDTFSFFRKKFKKFNEILFLQGYEASSDKTIKWFPADDNERSLQHQLWWKDYGAANSAAS